MRLHSHAGLGGFVSWEHRRNGVIIAQGIAKRDEKGLPRDHHNLITDAGLDSWGSNGEGFRAYCAIGTDSTAPSESDVALGDEVMSHAMGGSSLQTHSIDSDNQTITVVGRRSVTFTFSDNYNIKEIGFRAGSSGDLSIRTLPKDESDNPITISVQTNDTLTIHHDLSLTLSPYGTDSAATLTVKTYDRDGTLLSSDDYAGKASFATTDNEQLFNAAKPSAVYGTVYSISSSATLSPSSSRGTSGTGANVTGLSTSVSTYVADSYSLDVSWSLTASQFNMDTWGFSVELSYPGGLTAETWFIIIFDSAKFTKDDEHTLELTLTRTWDRATT